MNNDGNTYGLAKFKSNYKYEILIVIGKDKVKSSMKRRTERQVTWKILIIIIF